MDRDLLALRRRARQEIGGRLRLWAHRSWVFGALLAGALVAGLFLARGSRS